MPNGRWRCRGGGGEANRHRRGGLRQNTWAAIQGRERLKVTWDDAQAERRNTEEIYAEFRQVAQKTGVVAKSLGKPDEVFDKADKVIEAEYTPYVAHAPMEPLDGYLFWDGESVKARYGCQIQTLDHKQLCDLFELPPDKVQIETILAGGSFGRRIDLGNPTLGPDLAADMAAAAKGIGPGHGVKVVWTREDDIRNGWYRPMILHRLRGAIRGGKVVGWTDTVVGHSWTRHSAMDALVVNGLDQMMVEGASEVSYTFEAFRCDAHIVPGRCRPPRCGRWPAPTPATRWRALSISCCRKPGRIRSKGGWR